MTDVTLTVTVKPETAARIIALLGGPAASVEYKVSGPGGGAGTNETDEPAPRIYGKAGEGRSRRTKDEMAEDEAIAERWAALWPSKEVPEKPVDEIKAHLDKIEEEKDDDDGFDVGGDEDEEADEVLDLEEFRAIIVKHSKKIGGKALAAIMAPYKNPGEVPENERRDYADKIIEAVENA